MPLTGIYGEPLEYLKALLQASEAFSAFAPSGDVYLMERIGDDANPPQPGDGWATLSYEQSDHRIHRGPFQIERSPRLTLVKCVARLSEAEKEAVVNAVGAIVADLNASADADLVTGIDLVQFGVDDAADPPQVGAIIKVRMNL